MRRSRSLSLTLLLATLPASAFAQTFYVSPTGNDAADGLTPATAWATLAKVDNTSFDPGANILFQRGGIWRESLSASSSGTVAAPITYGSYGSGTKPTFYGSNLIDKHTLEPLANAPTSYSTYYDTPVSSMYADGNFLINSSLKGIGSSSSANVNYVASTPNSFFYDTIAQRLYVNTGTSLATDTRTFSATVRDDVVYSNEKNNLVFKDLIVQESAKYDAGYAFRVNFSSNVQILNSEAYRTGKHAFGTINSTDFVGDGLKAAYVMPDQGVGGASALVSYSDYHVANTTSTWRNVTVSDYSGDDAFYQHGEGLGVVTLDNFHSTGSGITLTSDSPTSRTVATNVSLVDASFSAVNATISNLTISGADAKLDLNGGVTVTNFVSNDYRAYNSYPTPILVRAGANSISNSTINMNGFGANGSVLFIFPNAGTGTLNLVGNIFSSAMFIPIVTTASASPLGQITGSNNLFSERIYYNTPSSITSLQNYQAYLGNLFTDNIVANPGFVDADNGDYRLLASSAARNLLALNLISPWAYADIIGNPRALGGAADLGAYEYLAPAILPGDYNRDGKVDAADYTLWADQFGFSNAYLAADGNGDGIVDTADYTIWADHFGQTLPASSVAIPEPSATFAVLAIFSSLLCHRLSRSAGKSTSTHA